VGDRHEQTLGEPILPTSFRDVNFEAHESLLELRLNEADAFDQPMKFKNKDFMEIVINNQASEIGERYTYGFEYMNGKWQAAEYDPFELMNRFKEVKFGKVDEMLSDK
jgi:hypothetical protein